jgi:hypothetical protein
LSGFAHVATFVLVLVLCLTINNANANVKVTSPDFASSNFPVADFASKQSTQRALFFCVQQPKHPGLVLMSIMQQPGGFWLHVDVVCVQLVVMLQDLQIEVV